MNTSAYYLPRIAILDTAETLYQNHYISWLSAEDQAMIAVTAALLEMDLSYSDKIVDDLVDSLLDRLFQR